jgi:16S rRNA (guanine(966)-N(2))-methyltransferase RsmD
MRITGGTARGRVIQVPRNPDIRPTTDRTREAVFSMLGSLTDIWDRCLDLYAGTGALGIEALSRGAGWVDFVEKEHRSCDIIKHNLLNLGFKDSSHVYCFDVNRVFTDIQKQFDIIFMDPPYADKTIEKVIDRLATSQIVKENTVLVVSHSSKVKLNEEYERMRLVKNKRYGDTAISIYCLEDQS